MLVDFHSAVKCSAVGSQKVEKHFVQRCHTHHGTMLLEESSTCVMCYDTRHQHLCQ